jgi:hypothetical protein
MILGPILLRGKRGCSGDNLTIIQVSATSGFKDSPEWIRRVAEDGADRQPFPKHSKN